MKSFNRIFLIFLALLALAPTGAMSSPADHYIEEANEYTNTAISYTQHLMLDEAHSNFQYAINAYEKALALEPDNIAARLMVAQIYSRRKDFWSRDYGKAEKEYHKIIELDPGNAYAYSGLGFIHLMKTTRWNTPYKKKIAEYDMTNEFYKMSNELSPGSLEALYGLFTVYVMTGASNRGLEKGAKALIAIRGNKALLNPGVASALTFIFIDKITRIFGIFLLGLIIIHYLPRPFLKDDTIILLASVIVLTIVFINYFSQLFVPLSKLFLSYL